MNEHNHDMQTFCTSNCPRFDNLRISQEELAQARRISAMTVDELLAEMTSEQKDALRASVIGGTERNGLRTIDGSDWEYEDDSPPPVSGEVTRWLHQFEQDAYQRGKNAANGALKERIERLRKRNGELRQRRDEALTETEKLGELVQELRTHIRERDEVVQELRNERDELMARLNLIGELVERPINKPAVQVNNLRVFAERMRDFADRIVSEENLRGDWSNGAHTMADKLIAYVTGHSKENTDD